MQKTPRDIFDQDEEKDLRKKYESYLIQQPNSAYLPSDYVKELIQKKLNSKQIDNFSPKKEKLESSVQE